MWNYIHNLHELLLNISYFNCLHIKYMTNNGRTEDLWVQSMSDNVLWYG